MRKIHFVIGASGSGKTSAVLELERAGGSPCFFFDSIGVPSEQERADRWGTGEGWQRAMTIEWVKRISREAGRDAVLDGQTRPSFIAEACEICGVKSYQVILIDCSDDVRMERLRRRGQPELANAQMMTWARYLVEATTTAGGQLIQNDDLSIAETAAALRSIMDGQSRA